MGYFERGLEGFHKVKDTKNEAVVLLNIVRLHKIAAQAHFATMESANQFSGPHRHHFEEVHWIVFDVLLCGVNSLTHTRTQRGGGGRGGGSGV